LLFFGDSTVHNVVREGFMLEPLLVDDAHAQCPDSSCLVRTNEHCNRTYGIDASIVPNSELWVLPDLTRGEGPISNGNINPGCSDCSNCNSRFLDCSAPEPDQERCHVPHGGYVYTEFSRDVVWQTTMYKTTQENTASLLRDGYAIYPATVCVMAAGYHDMDVVFNSGLLMSDQETAASFGSVAIYMQNVKWYLSLYLEQVCRHVVWLANAAPLTDNYTQTIGRTRAWNEAVQQELGADEKFRDSTTYIDLWTASQTWPHSNNLHMDEAWNVHLADLFVTIATSGSGTARSTS
jgi:hypothetical protein